MRETHNCLNCEHHITGNFCSHCGQKTDTQRITFKHFIFHDILHGVWHFEKGILFTIKQAMIRPGHAALEYISGKRIRFYNVFYLTLLLIGLTFFINHIQTQLSNYYFNTGLEPLTDNAGKNLNAFLSTNAKLIICSFIPLLAINSFILFKRKKLNFSEHFIISGMMFLGVMIITTISTLLDFTEYIKYIDVIPPVIVIATPVFILLYLSINYYKTFSENYTKLQNSIRVLLFIALLLFELSLLLLLLIGYFTNGTYDLQIIYQ